MNIEKQRQDREKCSLYLERIENYLENNYSGNQLLKNLDWIRYYIEDLKLEIEINKTLAITELTHHDED